MLHRLALAAAPIALFAACGQPAQAPSADTAPTRIEPAAVQSQDQALSEWFEAYFEAQVARSPEWQTFLGRRTNYDQWNDSSDAYDVEGHELRQAALAEMRETFDYDALSNPSKLSYDIFVYQRESEAERFAFRNHWYEFHQFRAPHSSMPAFLINQHRVARLEHAEDYIARLNGFGAKMDQHIAIAEQQVADGIAPPDWSYPLMLQTSRNIISGAPFEAGEPSALLADFTGKVAALDISDEDRARLIGEATTALTDVVQPAYERVIAMLERHAETAKDEDGVWKLPGGEAYYASQLKRYTTTDLTADEIHELGLSEVARIHEEMRAIMETVAFEGSLQDFFVFLRTDPQFTLPSTEEGRAEYLALAQGYIDGMNARIDELFITKPKADLIVKRVEPFRERAAGKAFYQRPAADGSRPGIYYANLFDMAQMPTYQAEALAYHEAVPGHHMQIAIQQELEDVPAFRRFSGITAYSEGWGLYCEYLPKEYGFYEDPYSDFGRLAMELWRAARLVVDTGLHHKRWTREEAIAYLVENTPNPEGDAVKAIERYLVMPGQATAYKIGMLKILELRSRAEDALGEAYDIREFHEVVLRNGPVPLAVLEAQVDAYIAETLAG
ncbi:MAG: DUF885 domain-containing protein [Pseudomonadota bacterium]